MLATLGRMVSVGLLEEVIYKLRNKESGVQHDKSQVNSNPGRCFAGHSAYS